MKIGIDIDNCISNFDDVLLKEYLKHDKELRNTGIINENPEYLRIGMFDWTDEEEKRFYNENIENFYRSRHLGEFKKAKLSKIVAQNVKYNTDITDEVRNIIDEIVIC